MFPVLVVTKPFSTARRSKRRRFLVFLCPLNPNNKRLRSHRIRFEMRPLETLPPTETLEIENGLSLVPRVKLNLTIHPSLPSVSKPIDEWQLKRALIDFLKTSLSVSKIEEVDNKEEDVKELEKKFLEWRNYVAEKMDGIELNLEGVKYNLSVEIPASDDFERMRKDWEESYAFRNRGYSRGGRQEPDTIVLRGVPSRWFAEPRVSSKPSMLVTHTIFSTFGKIRNLNVSEDEDLAKGMDEYELDIGIVSGLHCKIIVQFEKYRDFYNALKVLCGRSLQKQGSRLSADYEVTWDKDGFFRNSRSQNQDKSSKMQEPAAVRYRSEAPRREPHVSEFTSNDTRRKRFK
ncbi:hypothetical protein Godav_009119, partial [Gossypium davidsonii]|nr:hypothetical protein [Gossypium davidsonii]